MTEWYDLIAFLVSSPSYASETDHLYIVCFGKSSQSLHGLNFFAIEKKNNYALLQA